MQLTVAGRGEGSPAIRLLRALLDLGLYGFAFFLGMGIAGIQISLAVVVGATVLLHLLGERVLRPTALDKPIAFYLLAVLVGAVAERASGASFLAPDVLGVWRLGAVVVLVGAIGDATRALRLAGLFLVAAALQGVYGVVQHYTGIDLFGSAASPVDVALFSTDRFRVEGTFSRHTTFAFVGGAVLVFVAAAHVAGALRGPRRLLALAVLPLGLASLFTTVRTVWGGLVVGLLAVAVVGRTLRRVVTTLLAVGVFVLAASQLSEPIAAKLERAFDPTFANNSHRAFMWARSMAMLEDHPATGIGPGTFTPRTKQYYDPHSPQFPVRCHSHNNLLFAWVENGPLGLLAFLWCFFAVLSALRRGAKALDGDAGTPEARALVWGSAAAVGATLFWSFFQDPLYDGVIAYTLAFCIALGLAAAWPAAAPSAEDTPIGELPVGQETASDVPAPGTTAAVAALAVTAAAAGGLVGLDRVGPGDGLAAAVLLTILGLGHVPGLPGRIGPTLRGIAGFAGVVVLAGRAFAPKLIPGSAAWWVTPGAAVAVAALAAGLAGAAWASRRPGQVGPAPVAGAAAFTFAAGWIALNHHVLLGWLGVWETAMPTSYNFAAAAGAASLLFVAWTGPLGWGEVEARGFARRLVRLPLAAVAAGLAVIAAVGLLR